VAQRRKVLQALGDKYEAWAAAMTPKAYAKALALLEAGTLSERRLETLEEAAEARLAQAGTESQFAEAIVMFWSDQIERRQTEAEAAAIAVAARDLLNVLDHSPSWRPYLQLPDAVIWGEAGASIMPNDVPTLALADYLRRLCEYLWSDNVAGSTAVWGRRSLEDRRKSKLLPFVIHYLDANLPHELQGRPDATRGQRRYGRNAAIAGIATIILARRVTRQTVAQTLKKTV